MASEYILARKPFPITFGELWAVMRAGGYLDRSYENGRKKLQRAVKDLGVELSR